MPAIINVKEDISVKVFIKLFFTVSALYNFCSVAA